MNDNPVFWEHGVFLQPQHFQLEYIQNVRRAAAAMALLNRIHPERQEGRGGDGPA